jgi:hypothetical protein
VRRSDGPECASSTGQSIPPFLSVLPQCEGTGMRGNGLRPDCAVAGTGGLAVARLRTDPPRPPRRRGAAREACIDLTEDTDLGEPSSVSKGAGGIKAMPPALATW